MESAQKCADRRNYFMKWKGWQQLRQNKKNGISMVVVICVSAFFVAFAAAILYTAGLLTAQSNLRLKEERCNQLATSAAKVLNEELLKYDNRSNDVPQDNTFYAFANIESFGVTAEELAIDILQKVQVVVTPGTAFGEAGEGFIRMSFASSEEELREAVKRLKNYFNEK